MVQIGCIQKIKNMTTIMALYILSLTMLSSLESPSGQLQSTTSPMDFSLESQAEAMSPIAQAFQTWAINTHFKFSQIENHTKADIKVSFQRRDHGDGGEYPFDGAGGNLAHAIGPTNWGFHYDVDEQWSVGAAPGAFDLETLALHGIGHLLGLEHSEVQESIMWLIFSPGGTKDLHRDDINDIKALYNV